MHCVSLICRADFRFSNANPVPSDFVSSFQRLKALHLALNIRTCLFMVHSKLGALHPGARSINPLKSGAAG